MGSASVITTASWALTTTDSNSRSRSASEAGERTGVRGVGTSAIAWSLRNLARSRPGLSWPRRG